MEMTMTEGDVETDVHAVAHDDSCNVSLHSVMQSNVPEPYGGGSPTHLNMPGNGIMQRQRVEGNSRLNLRHRLQVRDFHSTTHQHVAAGTIQGEAYWTPREDFQPPAAQGVQGDLENDCMFQLWMENCHRYNLDCDEMLQGVQSGRKTLSQVFREQDELIRKVVEQSKVINIMQSTSSYNQSNPKVSDEGSSAPSPQSPDEEPKQSQKDRLKKAVKEYGSTVIVFHIGISLISLGGFYVLVSR